MAENKNMETFLAGLLIGGVIGAGIALLFAPASGKETRKFLSDKAHKGIEASKDGYEKVRGFVRDEATKISHGAQSLQDIMKLRSADEV